MCAVDFAVAMVALSVFMSPGSVSAAPPDTGGHWAEQILVEALSRALLKGYPDGTMRPDGAVTRAEFFAMACRALGEEENSEAASRLLPIFPDVPSDHWAAGYIRVCNEMGLVLGDEKGMAWPERSISRAELAAVISRLMRFMRLSAAPVEAIKFSDSAQIPSWALADIEYASSRRIFVGDDLGRFNPDNSTSRAEAVTALLRVLDLQGSRWDLSGVVKIADGETGTIRVLVGSSEIVVRTSVETRFFRSGRGVALSQMTPGTRAAVLYDRLRPGVAAVVTID